MRKVTLIIITLVLLYSCDTKFKAEKVESETYSNIELYETYLVSNVSSSPSERYHVLINEIIKKRIKKIYNTDSNINKFNAEFYEDVYCTRNYYENYEKLKGVESIIERCEDYYCGSFTYIKSNNNNQWYLIFPKNMRDTIYCDKK